MKLARTAAGQAAAADDPLAPVRVDLVRMGQQRLPADTFFQVTFAPEEGGETRVTWDTRFEKVQKQMGIVGLIMALFMGSIGTAAGVAAGTFFPAIPMILIGGFLALLFKFAGKSQVLYFEKEVASVMENFRTLMDIKTSSGVEEEIKDLRERINRAKNPEKSDQRDEYI